MVPRPPRKEDPVTKKTATTVLDQARNAIPGYRAATTAVDTIRRWMTENGVGEDRSAVGADVTRAVQAAAEQGADLPLDQLDRLAEFTRRQQVTLERNLLLRTYYDAALARQKNLLKGDLTAAHQVLVDQLAELYDEVNTHRDALINAVDAETAIRSGNPDAFTTADALCQRYTEIRAAHLTLATGASVDGLTSATVVLCGQVPNPLDHEPYWQGRRQTVRTVPGLNRTDPAVDEFLTWCTNVPTAHEPERNGIWPTDRPRTSWLLTVAGTAPVAPTADQLTDLRRLCETAVTPPRDKRTIDAALAARHALDGTPTTPTLRAQSTIHTVTL